MVKNYGLIGAGCVVLAWSWLGPLPQAADHSFTAHMTLHMLVVAVGTPLLAIGLAATRLDPVSRWPACFPPILASLAEMILVWLWHAPALHHVARHTRWGFVIEQASFCLAGWWLWQASFGGPLGVNHTERKSAGVLALLLTSMHMTLLGALIALSPRVLFQHSHGGDSLEQLSDQHMGGAVMLVVGGAAYLSGGLFLIGQIVADKRCAVVSSAVQPRQGEAK